jgi:hypothetical protein
LAVLPIPIGNNCQPCYAGRCEDRYMPTRNVNLTEHFDRFIETGVKSRREAQLESGAHESACHSQYHVPS